MAEEESYEIMPYKEVVALKKEIENLKKKMGDTSSKDLINSMARLTKGMDTMLQLFSTAAGSMKAEETTEEKFAAKIEPLMDKLDEVIGQNKTIAEGMVAIADIVKGQYKPEKPIPRPRVGPGISSSQGLPPLGQPPIPEGHGEPPGFPPEPPPGLAPLGPPPGMPPMRPSAMPPLGEPPGLPPLEEKPKKRCLFGHRKR